jgi:hypothetical protein
MASTSRYHNRIAVVRKVLFGAIEDKFGFTFLYSEKLVDGLMHFIAYFLTWL